MQQAFGTNTSLNTFDVSALYFSLKNECCFNNTDRNRFIAAMLGGGLGVMVGHPMDTMKVRFQVSNEIQQSVFHTFRNTCQKEGLFAFWRGVSAPVCTTFYTFGISLLVYAKCKNVILDCSHNRSYNQKIHNKHTKKK